MALVLTFVDQAIEPVPSNRARLPSGVMASRDEDGSETGVSRLATQTGV
jgi:hypothetical protein